MAPLPMTMSVLAPHVCLLCIPKFLLSTHFQWPFSVIPYCCTDRMKEILLCYVVARTERCVIRENLAWKSLKCCLHVLILVQLWRTKG